MVREAVLKSKDPKRILEEIEKIETLGNSFSTVHALCIRLTRVT